MSNDRIEAMVELSRALKAMLDADAYLESNIAARDYDGCEEGYVMRDTAAERLDKALSAWWMGKFYSVDVVTSGTMPPLGDFQTVIGAGPIPFVPHPTNDNV